MKFNGSFARLEDLRERIGARKLDHDFYKLFDRLERIKDELEKGIEIEPKNLKEEIKLGPFITYKGEMLAIFYIYNWDAPASELLRESAEKDAPKFHFTWCQTLEQMNQENLFDRYILSRSGTGRFRVEAHEQDGTISKLENVRLYPCQHCLKKLRYKGFKINDPRNTRLQAVENFSLEEFFAENDGNLDRMKRVPELADTDVLPHGVYTD